MKSIPIKMDRTIHSEKSDTRKAKQSEKSDTSDKKVETEATPWYFSPWPWLAFLLFISLFYLFWRLRRKG